MVEMAELRVAPAQFERKRALCAVVAGPHSVWWGVVVVRTKV